MRTTRRRKSRLASLLSVPNVGPNFGRPTPFSPAGYIGLGARTSSADGQKFTENNGDKMPVHYKSKGLFSFTNVNNSLKRLKKKIKELWENPSGLPPEPRRKSCTFESDPDE